MHLQIQLNAEQKQVIREISKRLADQQAAYIKVETECLETLARALNFANPAAAVWEHMREKLAGDEDAGSTVIFDDAAAWRGALTRFAQRQLLAWAEQAIALERSKLEADD